jgi:CSLREA domain-containing protein
MKKINLLSTAFVITALLIATFGGAQPVYAAGIWTVNSTNDPGDGTCDVSECTLREAVTAALSGDAINFSVTGTILLSSEIAITKALTISGPGAASLTVSGGGVTRVFSANSPSFVITISGLTIANGSVSGTPVNDGAGVYNLGMLVLNNVVLTNNTSTGANGGGGIYIGSHASLTVTNSTFSNNTSPNRGGGIANYGTLTVTNSTFSVNAANSGNGGGIFSFGTLTVNDSTFSGNTSTASGSGIYNGIATLTLKNSIVANGTGVDCYNGATTKPPVAAGNLIETNAAGLNACGAPALTGDPSLSALGNYGGSTPTFGLLPASPALNTADGPSCASTDQRGLARFGTCDIGAFESQGFTLSINSGDNQSALINIAFANPLVVNVTANNAGEPVDGGTVTFTPPASRASALITGSPATISGGSASVTATANNTAGAYNVTASTLGAASGVNFNLTNSSGVLPPDTQINSHPSNPTNSASAAFAFSSPDLTATFECSLDGVPFAACTSPITYTGLSGGSHNFQVRAKDTFGNVDPTPASFAWIIDTVPPDTQIDSSPTNPSYSASAAFTFSSPDLTATFECKLDTGAFAACVSPQTYASLTQGSHTFQVRAKDPAGNIDATPASYTWTVYTVITATFTSNGIQDGWILESAENSNLGGSINATATTICVGDDAARRQYRSLLSFNASGIPDTAVIVSANLKVKQQSITGGGDPFAIFGGLIVDIRNGFFGTTSALQITDFQAAASNTQAPVFPSPVGNWYTIDLVSGMFPSINLLAGYQTGLTQFRLRFNLDDNNNAIANYISFFSGNAATAGDRPVLEVMYYVP